VLSGRPKVAAQRPAHTPPLPPYRTPSIRTSPVSGSSGSTTPTAAHLLHARVLPAPKPHHNAPTYARPPFPPFRALPHWVKVGRCHHVEILPRSSSIGSNHTATSSISPVTKCSCQWLEATVPSSDFMKKPPPVVPHGEPLPRPLPSTIQRCLTLLVLPPCFSASSHSPPTTAMLLAGWNTAASPGSTAPLSTPPLDEPHPL
jgi:hypothetical protein